MPKEKVQHGEVFTPPDIVELMLDKLDLGAWLDPDIFFTEASCGDGAFVIPIVERRFRALGGDLRALRIALNTIWGWDIQQKNVRACRERLMDFVYSVTQDEEFFYYAVAVVSRHISCRDSLKHRNIPCSFDELTPAQQHERIERIKKAESSLDNAELPGPSWVGPTPTESIVEEQLTMSMTDRISTQIEREKKAGLKVPPSIFHRDNHCRKCGGRIKIGQASDENRNRLIGECKLT